MQQTVQKITQKLIDRLPENDQYYRLHELRSWEFPSFIVRRIKIELERNLAESMIIPKTDWANTKSDAVLDAWQQFVDAIRAEARLPASYAQAVIETAVADVVEILVQPRKNIPGVIFGNDKELGYEDILERLNAIVVYPHFPALIKRYMEKKELDSLSKKQCAQLVAKADERVTAKYSPLNWAQMLEPLFDLLDGEIDTDLLRLFFEDKKKRRIARHFDLMDGAVSRAKLIEVLSSPDLLNFDGYEDEQSQLFEEESGNQEAEDKKSDPIKNPAPPKENPQDQNIDEDSADISSGNEESSMEKEESTPSQSEGENLLNSGFSEKEETDIEIDDPNDEENDENSLNGIFAGLESKEKQKNKDSSDSEIEEKAEAEKKMEAGQSSGSDTDIVEKEENESSAAEKSSDESSEARAAKEEIAEPPQQAREVKSSDSKETPMWMRYMSDEEIEEYKKQQEEQDAETDEEGFVDNPIIDLTEDSVAEREVKRLQEEFAADRELFVEKIFRGSERAFDEALEEIAVFDNWREASKYIEKDIFKRNLVDMYSEVAVDFTDRLQGYFLEKQNQN